MTGTGLAFNNYADTIVSTWPWTKGYPPWLAELKLALDDFGRDTLLLDRLGTQVRIGDIFAATLQAPCPCANTPFNQTDWYAIEASFKPKSAVQKKPVKVCDPPWDVEDCCPEKDNPANFLPRPPLKYTYFVFYDAVRQAYIGRSFFQCEQTVCSHGESAFFITTNFSSLEYIGNLIDTPEKFILTLASEIPGAVSPDILKFGSSYVRKVNEAQHFR
jgi:hypothetical protein